MIIKALLKEDTSILKGFAILCILIHNYFHWLEPIANMENEFGFKEENVFMFFSAFAEHPMESINILFSYLGHYGVQLFIFISGYGLAASMLNTYKGYKSFIFGRLRKLCPLVFIAIGFHYLMTVLVSHHIIDLIGVKSLLYKLLMIHTLIPNEGMSYIGPLWFVGMIFQLYLLFPILYKAVMKWGIRAFCVICILSYVCIYLCLYWPVLPAGISIMQNFVGHLPEFTMGILFFRMKDNAISILYFIVALIIFCLGNVCKVFFPLTFICITCMMLCVYWLPKCNNELVGVVRRVFAFFGNISMMLFATHSILRVPFVEIAQKANNPMYTLYVLVLYLICAIFVSLGAKTVYEKMVNYKR